MIVLNKTLYPITVSNTTIQPNERVKFDKGNEIKDIAKLYFEKGFLVEEEVKEEKTVKKG